MYNNKYAAIRRWDDIKMTDDKRTKFVQGPFIISSSLVASFLPH